MNIMIIMLIPTMILACGKNFMSAMDKQDTDQEASRHMEDQRPDKAISILEEELADDPENYQLMSLLSAGYAQKYGVDLISFAQAMADKKKTSSSTGSSASSSSSGNGVTILFKVLPAATEENINGVKRALNLLLDIPGTERTTADNFKLALLQTSVLGLITKKYDTDGDGNISPAEIFSLKPDDALAIIQSLLAAQSLASGSAETDNSKAAAGNIDDIKSQIDKQEGADDSEKLKNYLQKAS